ncbi:nuclear GTPase SLIP-GC [Dromiciops gliroides]|uniref:nuclear GTPase SLIP-GC n=1 Tax=Dromiciops gliroides TaxID=33562 RepID=UPI001CC46ACD|nr:nuclear GTPase SLIP-GC [Dromiciops gliroides]
MAEAEDFVSQEPHLALLKGSPRKRRRLDQKCGVFSPAEQSALKEYEKLELRTRRVLSNTYQKLIQSAFLDDGIPGGVKYLINRLLALIEKPSLEPIYIGLFGAPGAGKSSLLNAIIHQAMFLPVSGESVCTSCIVQVSSSICKQYEAKIHLLSDQEWKEELRNLTKLLQRPEEEEDGEENSWDRDNTVEEAIWKLQVLYGNGAERKTYEELLRAQPRAKIPASRVITLKGEEANELSVKLDPYIRTQMRNTDGGPVRAQIWPLIKYVEVTLPKSGVIPEGVVLVDIPGTGDFNSKRDEMWKKTIDKCSVIWVISDIERISGEKIHEELLCESIKACQRGVCQDIALVVTKCDKFCLPEYLRERKGGNQVIESQREAILERNEVVNLQKNRNLKEKLKRKLPTDSKVLEASDLVYTVSAQEYWRQELLHEEETEISKLRDYIRKKFLEKKKKTVTEFVTEAFGILLLTDTFNSQDGLTNEYFHQISLRRFVEERIQLLEKDVDQCFTQVEQSLQEGVRDARTSYRRILSGCLTRSKGNQGFHQTLKAVCLKDGIYASRTLARIDLNEAITQPIYDRVDPVFGNIFRTGKNTSSALILHIDTFKHSLQEKMREVMIKRGWKSDSCKHNFLIQEINAILGGLEGHILRRKKRIYESLCNSVQNDLKLCYEEAAHITGKKACERMKDTIRRGVDRQVAEGLFERAQERMKNQFQQLKNGIIEKVKGNVSTMLILALPRGESLYKELSDVKNEYKEMEKLYKSLREIAENAVMRRGMQEFLMRMSPRKVTSPQNAALALCD